MEDHNSSFYYSNSTWDNDNSYFYIIYFASPVVDYIIISLGIPLSAVAVYVIYSLVRRDGKPAPVYVINLLISDIIQICCLFVTKTPFHAWWSQVFGTMYSFCLPISVAFMACITLERYLLVVWPLWYRFKRPTLISVVVSVLVWIVCAVVYVVIYFYDDELIETIFSIYLLLPFPVFIFCLGGSLRALSASRLPADEKRRIRMTLVLVLLIYTLLFLPAIITLLAGRLFIFYGFPFMLIRLNPLADVVLYIFMRKGAVDKLLAVCCWKFNCCKSSISSA